MQHRIQKSLIYLRRLMLQSASKASLKLSIFVLTKILIRSMSMILVVHLIREAWFQILTVRYMRTYVWMCFLKPGANAHRKRPRNNNSIRITLHISSMLKRSLICRSRWSKNQIWEVPKAPKLWNQILKKYSEDS